MSEKFKKLKAKFLLGAILKSVVCGISAGLVLAGILLLAFKLSAISLDVLWYIVIGVGGALVGGAVAFLFLRPTNKKVAKSLDNEFGLEERVQTSLEYSGQDGTIVQLQREDTEGRLNSLPKSKFKFSKIWQFCVIAVIAVAVAITAFFIPGRQAGAEGEDPDDPKAIITAYQIQTVQDIINNVKKSSLNDDVKEGMLEHLEGFYNTITGPDVAHLRTSQLNSAIRATISGVELAVNDYLTFIPLSDALINKGDVNIGNAVSVGGNAYKTYEIKEYGHVLTFEAQKGDSVSGKISGSITALKTVLSISLENGLADVMLKLGYDSVGALSKAGVDSTDTLYVSLNYFFNQLVTLSLTPGEDDKAIQNLISGEVTRLSGALGTELSNQAYAGAMRRYVSNKLKIVFGIGGVEEADKDDTDYGGNEKDPDNNPNKPSDPGNNTGGGGDNIYGSNDDIYNPETSQRQKYLELADKYSTIFDELQKSGLYTDEELAMINAYFDYLYGINSADKE